MCTFVLLTDVWLLKNIFCRYPDLTHAQKQALVLLDGTQAAQETRHHDYGAEGDDEVGSGERGEGGRESGEAALRNWEPYADTQQSTASQLKHTGNSDTSCWFGDDKLL